jgi:hypothetical protein
MRANLQQRLKRLEGRVKMTDEPEEFVIEFVGPEKEVVRTLAIRRGRTRLAIRYRPARPD